MQRNQVSNDKMELHMDHDLEIACNLCFFLFQKVDVSESLLWFDYRNRPLNLQIFGGA